MARTLFLWFAVLVFGVLLGMYLVPDPDTVAERVRAERPVPKYIVRGPPKPVQAMRNELAGQIRRTYEEHTKEPIADDLLDAALAEAGDLLRGGLADRLVGQAYDHELRRRLCGTLAEPVDILLQARGGQKVTILADPKEISQTPLALDPSGSRATHVRGAGAIPPGKILVLEEAALEAKLGTERGGGTVRICLGASRLEQDDLHLELRVGMSGRAIIQPGAEDVVSLYATRAAASLRLRGRLVDRREAAGLRAEPFRWLTGESDGLLGARPVLVQVSAGGRSGWEPREAAIDGSYTPYFHGQSQDDLWDERADPATLRRSVVHFDGAGLVPEGKVYVLRRVEYRARLTSDRGRHADFVVAAGGREIVKTDASEGLRPEGVWEGEIRVEPGHESDVYVGMHDHGIGEARFFGELVDSE